MKNPLTKHPTRLPKIAAPLIAGACAFSLASPNLLRADEEWEWEAGEGFHEEEWYDPSDWFNEDRDIAYEYDYPYYSSDYWDNDYYPYGWDYDPWYGEFDYDYDTPTTVYYDWDAENQEWRDSANNTTTSQNNTLTYNDETSQNQNAQQQDQRRSREQLRGTIAGFRHLDVNTGDRQEEHTVVKITLQDGSSRVVNLGRKIDLENLELEKGADIQIRGRSGTVGERDALIADAIRIGGKEFAVDRFVDTYNFVGTIKDHRRASLGDKRQEHLLVRLELEKGQDMIVDFGPKASLEQLDLDNGDQVRVQGSRATVNGQSVLVAKRLYVDGTKELDKADRQNQQASTD